MDSLLDMCEDGRKKGKERKGASGCIGGKVEVHTVGQGREHMGGNGSGEREGRKNIFQKCTKHQNR